MAKTVLVFAGLWLYVLVSHVELFSASFIQTDNLSRDAKRREPPPGLLWTQQNISWDYLLLAVQWPQSFCYDVLDMGYTNSCVVPSSVDQWTVHGLWPQKLDGDDIFNCNTSYPFSEAEIEDLLPEMNKSWPSLLKTDLWAHEWNKHGTCAGILPQLNGEHNYFKTTLELLKRFKFDSIFESQKIFPSDTKLYKVDNFTEAIQKAIGRVPIINCYTTSHGKKQITYILQMRLCLDKTFEPMVCPHNSPAGAGFIQGNCGDRNITYPTITHT